MDPSLSAPVIGTHLFSAWANMGGHQAHLSLISQTAP